MSPLTGLAERATSDPWLRHGLSYCARFAGSTTLRLPILTRIGEGGEGVGAKLLPRKQEFATLQCRPLSCAVCASVRGMYRKSATLPNMKGSISWLLALIVACAIAMGLPSFSVASTEQQVAQAARAHEVQGNRELKTKNWNSAAREFRTALSLNPDSVAAHVGLGVALQESGDAVGAVSQFQKAIQLDPHDAAAHYHLAVAFGREGNLKEAKAELRQSLELKPDSAEAHYTLGLLLVDWPYPKDFPGAVKQFEEALKYKPNFPEAHEELGDLDLTLGNSDAALAQFRAAIKLKPHSPEAYRGIGRALKHKGDLQGAFEAYATAVRLSPDDGEAHYNLGLVLMQEKKVDEAIAEFREAIKLNPGYERSYYDLGRALTLKGQTQAAKVEFQMAWDLHHHQIEENGQAVELNNAGVALLQRREFPQAEAKLRSALDINPTYGDALFNLGLVLAAQGEFNPAIAKFRKALVQEPINPRIHFDLARALELDGNLAGAIREFQLTLRLRPGYPGIQEALAQALQHQQAAQRPVPSLTPSGEKVASGVSRVRRSAKTMIAENHAASYPSLGQCENTVTAVTDPHKSPTSLRLAAVCAFGLNDFSSAIPLLAKAAQLNPGDEDIRILLARAYAAAGHNRAAIETLQAWTQSRGKEDIEALYWTGKFYDELANRAFQQMEAAYPHNYLVYETEGNQFMIKRQFPQALASFKKALALAPKNTPGLHFNLGEIYWQSLHYHRAERELEQELRINPYHARANYELGDIYAKEGDPQKAVPLLSRAISLDPSLVAAHRSLGLALMHERQYNPALAQFLIVAKAKPTDYTICNMLATTYRMMGRLADAQREAAESRKLYQQYTSKFQAIQAGEQKLPK
jgi:tetratricopeptide (TPR) repeat protein